MATIETLASELRDRLGREAVLTEAAALDPYLREWRGAYPGRGQCVVRPADTGEVARTVECVRRHGGVIVPQSGNTGLVGGASPGGPHEVIVSLDRMERIRSVEPDDGSLVAEAGCILSTVQHAARDADRLFPLTLASETQCRIGGNLATNAGGLNVVRYGNTRDLTLGLEVVLADGSVWSELQGLRKDNSGLDLRNLFIGSEGTLGIITAARLKLFQPARRQRCAWIPLARLHDGLPLLRRAQAESGEAVSGCEVMSGTAVDLALRHHPQLEAPPDRAPWHLLLEWRSSDPGADLDGAVDRALAGVPARLAREPAPIEALWAVRRAIPAAQTAEGASLKHDLALPLGALAAFTEAALSAIHRLDPTLRPCVFGHLGDGNLHFNVSQPASGTAEELYARAGALRTTLYDEVERFGGSIAAEHGVGQLRRDDVAARTDPVRQRLMRRIKAALDPDGVFNPGKLYGNGDTLTGEEHG